jgi:hypothetical protein
MNRFLAAAMMALLLSFALTFQVFAQEPAATLNVDAPVLTVGDPVQLRLEVNHPSGTVAILPHLDASWGELEVRSQSPALVTENEDGSLATRQLITVARFSPGDYETSSLEVTIANRDGSTKQVPVAPARLKVQSVLTEADTQPRDIKAQAAAPTGIPAAGQLALGVAALVTAIALAWLGWRRIGGLPHVARTPLERALRELGAIEATNYPRQGRYKEMYLAVSQTVRNHIEREYGIRLHDRTTGEMRAALRGIALPADETWRLLAFFAETDLVKYAQGTPTPESAAALVSEARAVVQDVSHARASLVTTSSATPVAGAQPS